MEALFFFVQRHYKIKLRVVCAHCICAPFKNHVAFFSRSGIDVNNVIETAESFNETGKVEERRGQLSLMTKHIHR